MKNVVKKYLIVIIAMLAVTFLGFSFCNAENSSAKEGSVYYTCPMAEHSDVVMDKPGKCPKCGMKLVPKEMGRN